MKLNRIARRTARAHKAKAKRAKRLRRDCTEYIPNRPKSPPKKRYSTPEEAAWARRLTFIMDPSRGPVDVFHCCACGCYHIGHRSWSDLHYDLSSGHTHHTNEEK